jgi:tetratricopeptide (TPR) repeat protein
MGSFPHILGLPIYLGALVASLILMIKYSDWRRWAGFAVFSPVVLFSTEFATVWIQDPFVLYRSYLWAAIGFPLLIALAILDRGPRTIMIAAATILLLFGGLAIERVLSLKTEAGAWADAANKIDFKAQRNAVGRWRPLLNRGNQYLQKGMFGPALDDYNFAKSFGEPSGLADYHRAVVLQQMGRLQEAFEASQEAEKLIARNPNPHQVYLHKGTLLFQLGRFEDAIVSIDLALTRLSDPDEKQQALKTRAQSNIKLGKNGAAIVDYLKLVELDPSSRSTKIQLAMAMNRDHKSSEATLILDKLLAEKDGPDIRFARALVFSELGKKADALFEARVALQLKPGDQSLQGLLRKIESGN